MSEYFSHVLSHQNNFPRQDYGFAVAAFKRWPRRHFARFVMRNFESLFAVVLHLQHSLFTGPMSKYVIIYFSNNEAKTRAQACHVSLNSICNIWMQLNLGNRLHFPPPCPWVTVHTRIFSVTVGCNTMWTLSSNYAFMHGIWGVCTHPMTDRVTSTVIRFIVFAFLAPAVVTSPPKYLLCHLSVWVIIS